MQAPGNHHGLIATFDTAAELYQAATKLRDQGFKKWDTYAPFPIHGMEAAMGLKRSKVPVFTLLGGITGFLSGVLLVWYMNSYDYPLIVGGKPFFSPVFPFPIFYELTILCAAFGALIGMFMLNRLPCYYHAIFEHACFERASDDLFFIFIDSLDPLFHSQETQQLLETIGGHTISTIYD